MKKFVGYLIDKAVRKMPRSKKVSPDIKSIGPSKTVREKGVKASVEKAKGDEFVKRIRLKDEAEKKLKTGKEMKRMIDTGRAKKVGGTVFHKGVKEKKMGGGMMGRRFGMRSGTPKPKTNVQKIK